MSNNPVYTLNANNPYQTICLNVGKGDYKLTFEVEGIDRLKSSIPLRLRVNSTALTKDFTENKKHTVKLKAGMLQQDPSKNYLKFFIGQANFSDKNSNPVIVVDDVVIKNIELELGC
jgi:hypothetical protein